MFAHARFTVKNTELKLAVFSLFSLFPKRRSEVGAGIYLPDE
jgi:hypothetical protein